ncbi:MAG: hypothetical protein WC205_16980 [Opitutaceae bacterium]|jgi:hypothetical protein
MAERRISILINSKGDVSGFDAIIAKEQQLQGQSNQLFAALKAGAAIDIGGRLVGSIAQIPAAMDRAIERGVAFNATLETAALGIAAVMKQFDTEGRFKTFDDAMAASAQAIELLKQKAKESPATFQSLVQSYQALSGPLTAANIPMEKQVELIVNMSQALSGLGISSQQLLQETRALVTGNINADAAAAKILGVTAADVNGAKAKGQLYEFLTGKISAFAEAGKRGAQTYQTAMSNLEDAIDDVLAKVTKPIFEAMTKGTLDLSAALNDPAIVQSLSDIGEGIASLVKSGYDLTIWAIENRDALIFVAKAAAALGAAYTAVNVTNLLIGLALKAAALIRSTVAIEAETAALARNTTAQVANAAARAVGGAASYGRTAGTLAAAGPDLARLANAGRFSGSILPAASAAAPAAAGAGVTGGAIAAVVAPLVIAALAGWLIRAQINATADARTRRIEDQGNRYGSDTVGNAKAMSSMVTSADKLAVYERIRTQEAKAQQDLYDAINQGDAVRVQQSEQQLKFLALQRGQVEQVYDRVHAINGAEADRLRLLKETEAFIKNSEKIRDDRAAKLPETQKTYDDTVLKMADDQEKLDILRRRRAELPSNASIATYAGTLDAMPAGKERDAAEQRYLELSRQVLEVTQDIEAVQKSIAEKIADQAKELAKQQQSRADYVLDIQITEARAKGLDQVADRLENEKKLREEIHRVMEATGATEEEAERAARRKLSAEYQLAQLKKPGAASTPASLVSRPSTQETISIYDNRAVGRLSEADANGRIPLVPTAPSFSSVVPQISRTAGAAAGVRGPAGTSAADLAGVVASAADAVKTDASAENIAKLHEKLKDFGQAIVGKSAATDKAFQSLIVEVGKLTTQVKDLRTQ